MSPDQIIGTIQPPDPLANLISQGGGGGIGTVLSNIIKIIYAFAGIAFVFMVIFSAFQWIVSGGDKERVAQARARLTYAIMGIILLAITVVILRVIGGITNFTFFSL